MDIYPDIERATHIPYVENDAKFYRRKQPRIKPMPAPRLPRNAELLEEYPQDYYSQKECMDDEPRTINPIEIATSIRMAAGTISCTSEEVEEYWRARQSSNTEKERVGTQNDGAYKFVKKIDSYNAAITNGDCGNTSHTKKSALEDVKETVGEETVLKSCKLHRNAAIKGLINTRIISEKDLTVPENTAGCSNTNIDEANPLFKNAKGLTFVPSPHDPDILITPLQAFGIDESKYKHIDFTVPRLGRKTTITPIEYNIYCIDDDDFNFVQKKPTREKK